MARPKNPAPPLRDSLAQAALVLVRELGPDGLTVRAVAKAVDVTSNAPYFYYPGGVAELLATVAIEGFRELRSVLGGAMSASSPVERVTDVAFHYVGFGVQRPNLYRAMFHSRLAAPLESRAEAQKGGDTFDQLRQLKLRAYGDLVGPLASLRDQGMLRGSAEPDGAPGLALAALAHGLVGEFIDEGLLRPESDEAPWTADRQTMTVECTEVLLRGLLGDVESVGSANR